MLRDDTFRVAKFAAKAHVSETRQGIAAAVRWAARCLISLLVIAGAGEALAAGNDYIWDGGAGNGAWSNATNWNATPTFDANANLLFAGSVQTSTTNTLASGTLRTIQFSAGASAFTLSGSAVTIGNGSPITNNSTNTQTINLAGIAFSNGGPTINAASGNIVIGSRLSGAATDLTFTAGSSLLGTTLTGSNAHISPTLVTSGFLRIENPDALGTTAGSTTVSNNASLQLANNITVRAETISITGTGSGGGSLRNISGSNTLTGTVSLAGAARINSDSGTLTFDVASGNAIEGTADNLTFGGAGNITVNDVINNTTATLTKDGVGLLTLAASNTYSGATTISAGSIRATTSTNALGQGTLSLGGGTLELANDTGLNYGRNTTLTASGTIFSERLTAGAGVNHTLGTLSIGAQSLTLATDATVTSGTAGLTFGAVTLTASGTLIADAGTLLTTSTVTGNFGLAIGGAGNTTIAGFNPATVAQTLTKSGAGTLTLSATSAYTGLTTISGGTLAYGVANALSTGGVTIQNDASLNLSTFGDSVGQVTLTRGNIVGSGTLTSTANFNTNSGTISAVLAGTNFGIVQGTGTTVVTSSNAFTGGSSVASGGVLNVRNAGALGTTGTATVSSGGALELQNSGTLARVLSLSGTGISGGGALRNVSGTNGISAAITLGAATRINSDADLLTLSGTTISGAFGLTFGGAGNITVSNTIATGANTLTKDGAGTLKLSGSNTYTGATTVSAGVLNVHNSSGLGTTAGGVTVSNGAALELQGGIAVGAEALSIAGTGISSGGALRNVSGTNSYAGAITQTAATLVNVDAGQLTLSGNIGGGFGLTFGGAGNTIVSGTIATGANGLTKTDAGLLTLSASNTYTGATLIQSGTLRLGLNNAISGSSAITIGSVGSKGALDVATHSLTISSLTFADQGGSLPDAAGTVTLRNLATGTARIDVLAGTANEFHPNVTLSSTTVIDVASNAALLLHATLSGASPLTKSGAGLLEIFGNNEAYSGLVSLRGGTTSLLGGNSTLGSGTTTVFTGATLNFNGRPFTGSFVLAGGNILNVSSGSSQITISGTSTISGSTSAADYTVTSSGSAGFDLALTSTSAVVVDLGGRATFNGSVAGLVDAHGTSTFNGNVLAGANVQVGQVGQSGASSSFLGNVAAPVTVNGGAFAAFSGTVSAGISTTGTVDITGRVASGGGLVVNAGGVARLLDGAVYEATDIDTDGSLIVNRSTNLTVGATIDGTGSLTKQGASTLTLTNANGFTGGSTISAGTVALSGAGSLAGTGAVSLAGGAGLDISAASGNRTIGALSGTAGSRITLGGNGLTAGGATSTTFAGSIAGTGGFTKAGAGGLTFTAANAYTGATTIAAGTLGLSGAGSIQSSSGVNLSASGAAFSIAAASGNRTIGALEGVAGSSILLGSNGLTAGNASNTVFSGGIIGSGGFTKVGSGILELAGVNTFAGLTALEGGSLLVNGALASDVATLANTTLGGSGSIAGTLSGAGLVSPGNSPGILEAAAFDPTGGLDAAFEFTGSAPNYANVSSSINDVLRLTGATPFNGSALGAGNVIDIYLNAGTVNYLDEFEGGFYAENFTPEQLLAAVSNATYVGWMPATGAGTRTFNGINYDPIFLTPGLTKVKVETKAGPDGGAVTVFVAVPEPGSIVLAGLGLIALAGHARLRRMRRAGRRHPTTASAPPSV